MQSIIQKMQQPYAEIVLSGEQRIYHPSWRGKTLVEHSRLFVTATGRKIGFLFSRSRWSLDIIAVSGATVFQNFITHNTIGVLFPHYTLNGHILVRNYPNRDLVYELRDLRAHGFTTHSSNSYREGICRGSCTVRYSTLHTTGICIVAFGQHMLDSVGTTERYIFPSARHLVSEANTDLQWRFDTECANPRCERLLLTFPTV